jgi:hypothetical protein
VVHLIPPGVMVQVDFPGCLMEFIKIQGES